MRTFKIKILAIISCLLVLCCTLSACDPAHRNFDSEDFDNLVSIELINYNNPEQKHFVSWVPDHSADLKPFDNSKMNRVETLDENRITDFIDNLCECDILYKYYAFDSPNGTCIKLNYSNGNFMIVWGNYKNNSFSGYIGIFSADGEISEFIGCFSSINSYIRLVNDYFQTQI